MNENNKNVVQFPDMGNDNAINTNNPNSVDKFGNELKDMPEVECMDDQIPDEFFEEEVGDSIEEIMGEELATTLGIIKNTDKIKIYKIRENGEGDDLVITYRFIIDPAVKIGIVLKPNDIVINFDDTTDAIEIDKGKSASALFYYKSGKLTLAKNIFGKCMFILEPPKQDASEEMIYMFRIVNPDGLGSVDLNKEALFDMKNYPLMRREIKDFVDSNQTEYKHLEIKMLVHPFEDEFSILNLQYNHSVDDVAILADAKKYYDIIDSLTPYFINPMKNRFVYIDDTYFEIKGFKGNGIFLFERVSNGKQQSLSIIDLYNASTLYILEQEMTVIDRLGDVYKNGKKCDSGEMYKYIPIIDDKRSDESLIYVLYDRMNEITGLTSVFNTLNQANNITEEFVKHFDEVINKYLTMYETVFPLVESKLGENETLFVDLLRRKVFISIESMKKAYSVVNEEIIPKLHPPVEHNKPEVQSYEFNDSDAELYNE